jgi:hypothetical protein
MLARLLTISALSTVMVACSARPIPSVGNYAPPGDDPGFIDLQPGWRLRVVTPILKSGGFIVQETSRQEIGTTITISSQDDFIGYENSYYRLSQNGPGVKIRFDFAEAVKNGNTAPQRQPLLSLFQVPRSAKFVRLIYGLRVSKSDHDMAVVAANRIDSLELITRQMRADPTRACETTGESICSWIPTGIAVRPEMPNRKEGIVEWIPARTFKPQ